MDNGAFSDFEFGYAFHELGQLRNGSDSMGNNNLNFNNYRFKIWSKDTWR